MVRWLNLRQGGLSDSLLARTRTGYITVVRADKPPAAIDSFCQQDACEGRPRSASTPRAGGCAVLRARRPRSVRGGRSGHGWSAYFRNDPVPWNWTAVLSESAGREMRTWTLPLRPSMRTMR